MPTPSTTTMNPNLKIFLAVFLFIAGAVGVVLAVVNASATPAATTSAVVYGVLGLALLAAGFTFVRKRSY